MYLFIIVTITSALWTGSWDFQWTGRKVALNLLNLSRTCKRLLDFLLCWKKYIAIHPLWQLNLRRRTHLCYRTESREQIIMDRNTADGSECVLSINGDLWLNVNYYLYILSSLGKTNKWWLLMNLLHLYLKKANLHVRVNVNVMCFCMNS